MPFLNLLTVLRELDAHKIAIEFQRDCGIITTIDANEELQMIDKKAIKVKEALVKQYHVNKNGTPRKITYREDKNLYTTYISELRTSLSSRTLNELYDKLLKHYGLTIHDTSFRRIFFLALEEKEKTENPNSNTIKYTKNDFKRFISDSLANKDIRKITDVELKEYTQKFVINTHPTKKTFYKYKSVLNLAFDYAMDKDIISKNPVKKINNKVYKSALTPTHTCSETKIHSQKDIERIQAEVRRRMPMKRNKGYFINGYAILLSIETGMRAGELCSLRHEDVKDTYIHIHSQQLSEDLGKGKGTRYYYAGYTKNEKGISHGGRKFPLTNTIKALLGELKALQDELGIQSEYVFCHPNGEWIKTDAYETCLRRLCESLGLSVKNNHAFRMSLNSNVFIPAGLPVPERARLLGHSVETNLKYYSFAGKDNLDDICDLLNRIA